MDLSELTPEEMRRDLPEIMSVSQIARWWGVSSRNVQRKIGVWRTIDPTIVIEQPGINTHGKPRKGPSKLEIRRDPLLRLMGSDPRGEVNEEIWRTSRSIDVLRIEHKRLIQRMQTIESENLGLKSRLRECERELQAIRATLSRRVL